MESPRITLARVLELGVQVSWREATAIVHEAIAKAGGTGGARPTTITAESCLLTRGGDVLLTGPATQASPEVVVRLLDDLLASCSNPGRFAGTVADGTALAMLDELSQQTTAKRRRVDVASVALRGLVAEADAARAAADADAQGPAAAGALAALALGSSPAPRPGPVETSQPASHSVDGSSAGPERHTLREATSPVVVRRPSFGWVTRGAAPLVWAVLAAAAVAVLALRLPATHPAEVDLSKPGPAEFEASPGRVERTSAGAPDVAPPAEPTEQPPLPRSAERNVPRSLSTIERPNAPSAPRPDSAARSMPAPTRAAPPVQDTAVTAESRLPSTATAAIVMRPPVVATAASARPAGSAASPAVANPGATTTDADAVTVAPAAGPVATATAAPDPANPASAVAAPVPRDRAAETRAVASVLGRYRTALNTLDAEAALAVWPSLNEKTLARAFESLESHDVSFDTCEIEILSVLAEAACSGRARYVPKVGSRTPRYEVRHWKFSLRKADGGWLIDRVDAR